MTQESLNSLAEQLVAHKAADGGWSYGSSGTSFAEPTALAALALATSDAASAAIPAALDALTRMQKTETGAVSISAQESWPTWPTSLALLAWRLAGRAAAVYDGPIRRALDWLLNEKGSTSPPDPRIGHDTTLVGWPWVSQTHSWIEPTSYAILACRAAGQGGHARVRQAVRLILDRAVASGGWNYGNTRVLDNELRAFPACTGIALLALAGEPVCTQIDKALDFLSRDLERIRTPMSLAWSLMGMTAWDKRPPRANTMIQESVQQTRQRPFRTVDPSLLLLAAAADRSPLVLVAKGRGEASDKP